MTPESLVKRIKDLNLLIEEQAALCAELRQELAREQATLSRLLDEVEELEWLEEAV